MKISDFLLPAQIMIDVKASDKGRLLEQLSTEAAAQTGLAADEVVRASQASGRHSRCSPASGTARFNHRLPTHRRRASGHRRFAADSRSRR